MKSPHRTPFLSIRKAAALAGCGLLLASSVFAQVAVESPAFTEPAAPVITASEAEALAPEPSPGPPVNAPLAISPDGMELPATGRPVAETPRRFRYTLSATMRGIYDDNINNSSSNHVSDYIFTIEPAIFIGLGTDSDGANSLSLIYHPSLFVFASQSRNDVVQQVIQLQAGHRFGHLSLSFLQDVQLLDGTDLNSLADPTGQHANIDVNGRTRHQAYNSQLSAAYDLTGKLFLTAGGFFTADQYPSPLVSSQNFGGNLFLNYIYSDKLTVGLGGTGGFNTTNDPGIFNNDQTYEQANLRFSYNATAKITMSASGGIEVRQFASGSGDNVSPIYQLAAGYQPFDGTSLSLSGSRRTMNSASLVGQDFAQTTIDFSLTQRFFQRFFVGVAVGYTNSDYFSTIIGVSSTRNDNFYYITPSIDFNITRFWSFGAYYVHREDSSSVAFSSFADNQVGIRTKLTF